MAQRRDTKLLEILEKIDKQEAYIEEFLLRIHKSTEDIRAFLATYNDKLHVEIKEYLKEIVNEKSRMPTERFHEEF